MHRTLTRRYRHVSQPAMRNMHTALHSRDVLGQAKGILMERYKVSASQAFDLLVTASQRHNRKLRDIADDLAATGEFRGLAVDPHG